MDIVRFVFANNRPITQPAGTASTCHFRIATVGSVNSWRRISRHPCPRDCTSIHQTRSSSLWTGACGFKDQETRKMVDQGIAMGRCGVFLSLTDKQYARLRMPTSGTARSDLIRDRSIQRSGPAHFDSTSDVMDSVQLGRCLALYRETPGSSTRSTNTSYRPFGTPCARAYGPLIKDSAEVDRSLRYHRARGRCEAIPSGFSTLLIVSSLRAAD